MGLAALIGASQDSRDAGLRALLPFAGLTLVERQARLAAAAGAAPILLLIERLPAGLAEAVDRLRAAGIVVEVARSAEEAADRVDPGDRLLLIADGFFGEPALFERIADEPPPALLTVSDAGREETYERIDAQSRWAGLALIPGDLLRETAAQLGEWDLQSTLLRRAVQRGARHVRAEDGLVITEGSGDLAALQREVVRAAVSPEGGWARRFLLSPIERAAVSALMDRPVAPATIGAAAAALTVAGAVAFGVGILWAGLALLVLAAPLDGIAGRLARLRMEDPRSGGWWRTGLPALAGAALLALGLDRAREDGWGAILLAAMAIAFLVALEIESEEREVPGATWLAEPKGMTLLMVPFALFGGWTAGLSLLFVYAAGSFFWAQRQVHSSFVPPRQD